ncbi:16314_t:CDS:10 [Entrophospora sp. SA101]|nr:16314_t:CDS:10 [Entrophospora sp. SA101]CAJ0832976.1 1888_t:CDS:10 [Entrophospora sp. SA101]CAJ0849798.1 513_t:CDS:10 [Entrophospora sp. SA101]CAJ0902856.1 22618_t:CDS:10 [Entrophospora sp. SA101]
MKVTLPILSVFVAISTLFGDDVEASPLLEKRAVKAKLNVDPGTYEGAGTSGVAVMHMVLTAPNRLVFIDKVNKNPLKQKNGDPAISTEFDIGKKTQRVLDLKTNTFCSAGAFTSDGTLVHTGGTGAEQNTQHKDGFQSIRLFKPCQNKKCQWTENVNGLSTKRWYPSMVSLSDGRVLILGGSTKATGINNADINNPTFEFFPSKKSTPKPFPFLQETLPRNLYPVVHLLSGPANQKRLFVFADVKSIVWDWEANKIVKRLPNLPGPSRSYPFTGTSVILPLRPEKNYASRVMVCGGGKGTNFNTVADNTCGTIDLSDLNKADWKMEDFGGFPRIMPDGVILADGKVMYLNGAGKGIAGYNKFNKNNTVTIVADNPSTTPVLYDPEAKAGQRFTSLKNAGIARMYHSVATLLPNDVPGHKITSVAGKTLLNKDTAILVKFNQVVKVLVETTTTDVNFTGALVHFGFVTHSTHMSQRYVATKIKKTSLISNAAKKVFALDVEMPPNGNMMPPGRHHYLYINNKGVPAATAIEINLQK